MPVSEKLQNLPILPIDNSFGVCGSDPSNRLSKYGEKYLFKCARFAVRTFPGAPHVDSLGTVEFSTLEVSDDQTAVFAVRDPGPQAFDDEEDASLSTLLFNCEFMTG